MVKIVLKLSGSSRNCIKVKWRVKPSPRLQSDLLTSNFRRFEVSEDRIRRVVRRNTPDHEEESSGDLGQNLG